MDKAALLALADRVEAMTGPCFDIEDQIEKIARQPWRFPPPNYTASLDAAMTLVPNDCNWLKCLDERGHTMFAIYEVDGSELGRSIYAGNDARCLTAAALRAMAGGEDA